MPLGLIARKVGMSRHFLPTGEAVSVTYLYVEDNAVVRTKTKAKDGYDAVVLGIGEETMKTRKGKEVKKFRTQKEFLLESFDGITPGGKLECSLLTVDSLITVTGISKGKGFQGVIKRHHFAGGPATHGSHFKREPGSVGMRTWPGRIHRGKRMPGRMGGGRITVAHRPVILCDSEQKIVGIKGPVPGPNGAVVCLTLEASPKKN